MVNQKSNFKTILNLYKRYQLKFSLFTVVIIGSFFLFYYNETLAVDEIANKSSLNNSSSSLLQIPNDNNTKTKNNSDLVFSNVNNITNNQKDSVYAQIAASNDNVYMRWQESVTEKPNEKNYDIFFIKSEDNGTTFSKPVNLSNNTGFSEHPQIAVTKNGIIFIVWADNTNSNNTEIMFTKSEDNGTTFSKPTNLSNSLQNSNNQEISAFNENVYVVWQDIDQNNNQNSSIIFKRSIDSGNIFNDAAIELANNTNNAYPKVNSYREHVYVVWNSENNNKNNSGSENDDNDENSGIILMMKIAELFFIKSSDKGNSFENSIRIANYNFGESQIAVNQNEVFITWGGLHAKNINDIYFVQSYDNGTTFTDPYVIPEKITTAQSKNR